MHAAVTRYRVMAYVTGVLLIVLFFVVTPVQLTSRGHSPAWTSAIGLVHGLVAYPLYLLAIYDMHRRLRWSLGRTVVVVLSGVIPFLSFVMERKVVAEVRRREPAATRTGGAKV